MAQQFRWVNYYNFTQCHICLAENPCKTYVGFTSSPGSKGVWRSHFFPCGYGSLNGSNVGKSRKIWKIMEIIENHGKSLENHGKSWKIIQDSRPIFQFLQMKTSYSGMFQNQPIPEIKTQTPILETLVECNLICIGSEVWDVYWYGSNFPQCLFVIRKKPDELLFFQWSG